jgi:outer membrane receptor protein involved in Fe transport
VFILDSFIVDGSEQQGYVATTSMSGTRLNQMVKDIPIPIDIITEDFIRDTGALTLSEALQYTAGLETDITSQQVGENPSRTGTSFRLRGFVSQAALRNGFRREGTSDTINVSQVDVVRGPNALLYGIGNFGGVVNYVTKVPLDDFATNLRFIVGSDDFYRGEIDVTGPVTDKLSYRIPLMYQTNKGWVDHFDQEKRGIAPVLLYKFTDKTRLQLEFDYYSTESTQTDSPLSSNFRALDNLPFIDPTYHPGNQGFLARPSPAFRYAGPDTFRKQEDFGFLAQLTHVFSDKLVMNLGVYLTETELTSRTASVALSPIQSILSPDPLGALNRERYPWAWNPLHAMYPEWSAEQFYALEYGWNRSESVRERDQARIEFAYKPDWFDLKHTIMFGVTLDRIAELGTPWSLKDRDRDPIGVTSGDFTGLAPARDRYQSIYNRNPIPFELSPSEEFMITADSIRPFVGDAIGSYLIHQTSLFDDKLRTIAGLRFDRYQVSRESRYTLEESLEEAGDSSLVARKKPGKTWQRPTEEFNYSLGVSYSFTPDIAAFILTASALDPETTGGQVTPDGLVPAPQSGQSFEVGLKTDFMEGKISGSFSLYTVTRENVVVDASILNRAPDSVVDSPRWEEEGRTNPGNKALREDRSSGFDAQFFFINFIPNFETIVTFSYNKYEILDAVYQVFQGVADDGSFIFENINARENVGVFPGLEQLPWDDSRLNNDTPEYSFRIWNKYTFRDSFLEGLDIGLGVRWTDRREASFGFTDAPSYKITPDRLSVDLALGYKLMLGEQELNLRVNVNNLLDDDKVYGYSYTTPRSWRLTASMRF